MGADEATSTRVYYHLDESTPYMSMVPAPPHAITLGDFKKVFGRRGYDYFCKTFDHTLNVEVKEALTADSQRLHKSANGHVELFLFSQSNGNTYDSLVPAGGYSAGTLPRSRHGPLLHASTTIGNGVSKLSKRRSSALALSSIVDELDVGGGQRVSMVTNERSMSGEASSDINTLISKRAGEHLADIYTSTSEDPYKYDVTSIPSFASSQLIVHQPHDNRTLLRDGEEADDGSSVFYASNSDRQYHHHSQQLSSSYQHRQRKPRRQKYRKAYVPSTISSASESSLSTSLPRLDEVKVLMQDGLELGISVACNDGSIFISRIEPGSAAEKCGRLEVGDEIIKVGKTSFETLSDEEAINELRKACRTKKPIMIYVAKRPHVSDQKSEALSLNETLQMNVSEWVEQTTKQGVDPPFDEFLLAGNGGSSANGHTFFAATAASAKNGTETSDEERAAYADRRNGVGPMLVPALQQSKKRATTLAAGQPLSLHTSHLHHHQAAIMPPPRPPIGPTTAAAMTGGGGHRVSPLPPPIDAAGESSRGVDPAVLHRHQLAVGYWNGGVDLLKKDSLHARMDAAFILQQMARPDSGLTIKDRKWLKIPVPNSFIGDEMVSWLLEHVDGFRDRKAARAYASQLLANGYIKHVVNMAHFNEKCYYIFDDAIINTRLRLLLQPQPNSQSTLVSNTNTTSTRVGSHNGPPSLSANPTATMKTVPESATELTYVGSAASPFFLSGQTIPNGMAGHAGKNATMPSQMFGGAESSGGCQQQHTIVQMATNPRYVSPPAHFVRGVGDSAEKSGAGVGRLTDANNNTIVDAKKPVVKEPTISGRPLSSRVLNGVWPISPIPLHHNGNGNGNAGNLRDCDSPATTNEYASVIQGEVNAGAQFDAFGAAVSGHGRGPKENNPPQPLVGRLPPVPPPLLVNNSGGGGNLSGNVASHQSYQQSQQQQQSQNPFMRNLCGH